MKFLVVLASILAATKATPLESGYGIPVAPVEQVVLPVTPPVVTQPAVAVARALPPLVPAPVRVLSRPAVVPAPPVPVQPLVRAAPLPFPAPIAAAARPPLPLPLVRSPVAALSPTPLAAGALPLAANPVPLAANPIPLAANPIPLAANPIPLAANPVSLAAAPIVPVATPSSQFHAQDEFGGVNFGYSNINSGRQEIRTPDGVTRGSYSYVDANGVPQTVNYVADALGFRVAATNLPVAPVAGPVAIAAEPLEVPIPVADTAEVAAAKAQFQAAFDEAVARTALLEEEAVVARKKRAAIEAGYGTPVTEVIALPAPTPVVQVPVAEQRIITPVGTISSTRVTGVSVAGPALPLPAALPATPLVTPALRAAPLTAAVPAPIPVPSPLSLATPLAAAPTPLVTPALRAATPLPVPVATPLAASPIPVATPLAAAAIPQAVIPSSQFQAQDELGNSQFGYQNVNGARQETRSADGVTTGSYSYVDANGIPQTVNYVADALGFRVAATNLPVAPVVA